MSQITTLEKFDHISDRIENHIDGIHPDNFGPLNEFFISQTCIDIAIQSDYLEELEHYEAYCNTNLLDAMLDLAIAEEDEKESKRIAKIRSRITGTGLTDDDFVTWAEGRKIQCSSVRGRLFGVYKHSGVVFGSYKHFGVNWNHVIDRSKVWRIA